MDTLIIGAGLAGLILANRIKSYSPDENVVIVEKSRGVGGRMATRRTDEARFDHGAQFYTLQPTIEKQHVKWTANSLVDHWFDKDAKQYFKCAGGMSALAKDLARDISIKFEHRGIKISKATSRWQLHCDVGVTLEADRLILTPPLPQSLELLRHSELKYGAKLDDIKYAKAVVALIELNNDANGLTNSSGYREFEKGLLFSIADQKAKGVSKIPALTVTMTSEASEIHYDDSDENLTQLFTNELKRVTPAFTARSMQIKKWRYSHPLQRCAELYSSPQNNLYLAGDAFGGPSLNGAARSANALADALIKA